MTKNSWKRLAGVLAVAAVVLLMLIPCVTGEAHAASKKSTVISKIYVNADGGLPFWIRFRYNKDGLVKEIITQLDDPAEPREKTVFKYDKNGRITEAIITPGYDDEKLYHKYSYDEKGRLKECKMGYVNSDTWEEGVWYYYKNAKAKYPNKLISCWYDETETMKLSFNKHGQPTRIGNQTYRYNKKGFPLSMKERGKKKAYTKFTYKKKGMTYIAKNTILHKNDENMNEIKYYTKKINHSRTKAMKQQQYLLKCYGFPVMKMDPLF